MVGVLEKTTSKFKVYQSKLKVIEEEFDIDYKLAAQMKDEGIKLRQELALAKKVIDDHIKGKEISKKLIKTLQNANEELSCALKIEKDKNVDQTKEFENFKKTNEDAIKIY